MSSCIEKQIDDPDKTLKEFDLAGSAQKGPFINGSNVNVYELDSDYVPTGRNFNTNTDAKGYFEIKGVKLVSPYVKIVADGYYFNEVSGSLSNGELSLRAIVDLSELNTININVLTNLEFDRVQNLVHEAGMTISEAKIQAQEELLKVFSLDSIQIENSESLDIINPGEGDAVLLAVSAILQGNRTTAELSKLQADMILDMKEDGILNDTVIQTSLFSQAATLNLDKIRQNLIAKYAELGIVLSNINDFDKYTGYFVEHSTYHYSSPFEFPVSTSMGVNFLTLDKVEFNPMVNYAFAVKMPEAGKIMIKLTRINGWGYWFYQPFLTYGWKVSPLNYQSNQQTFTSVLNGEIIDLPISFSETGTASVDYFYNESATPYLTKIIHWGSDIHPDDNIEFRSDNPMWQNLLALPDSSVIPGDSSYIVGVWGGDIYHVEFKLHFPSTLSLEFLDGSGEYTYTLSNGQLEFGFSGKNSFSEIELMITGEGQVEIENVSGLGNQSFSPRTIFVKKN